jgi:hypothetical protein
MQTNLLEDGAKDYYQMTSGPYDYNTANYYGDQQKCDAAPTTGIAGCRQIYSANNVDVESTLKGIDRKLTRYPAFKPTPSPIVQHNDPDGQSRAPIQRPKALIRGTEESWAKTTQDFPIYDPQQVSQIVYNEPIRGGLNSRVIARETYQPGNCF